MNQEVKRLLENGMIHEVQYPKWLANPVVVPKKNGKIRVCIDFTNLNKVCPKDSFPFPHIDRMVDAIARHELLIFLDVFSGYNQILMHPGDEEKTSFILEWGTYCYKRMLFGLKNAGATFQKLTNKMFSRMLGKMMEIYIGDKLVKSTKAKDQIRHLEECFNVLRMNGMKLNLTKYMFKGSSTKFLGFLMTQRGSKLARNRSKHSEIYHNLRI